MFEKKTFRPVGLPARLLVILTAVLALGLTPMLTARDAAAPAEDTGVAREFTGDPMTLHLNKADLGDVLATFSKLTGFDILTEAGVKARISCDVKDEPWDSVLDRILKENGLTYSTDAGRIVVRRGADYVAPVKKGTATSERTFEGDPVFKYVTDGVITEPKKLGGPNPVYPQEARKAKEMGVVILECIIGADGTVRNVDVLRSPRSDFSKNAVAAVEQWTFEPALLEGKPVDVIYILTVRFNLK